MFSRSPTFDLPPKPTTDILRTGMHPWTFTVNWLVRWKDFEWEKKTLCAFFVGR